MNKPPRFAADEVTQDAFLGGKIQILQPVKGYRAATDPVFLAAACVARAGQSVLDVGSGAGTASFCLAHRTPGLAQEGVELSPDYAKLSEKNAQANGFAWRVHNCDITAASPELRAASYDHVITNPPFFIADAGLASPDAARDAANRETTPLSKWLDFCLRRLKPKGWLTIIHRAERLPEILSALDGRAGDCRIAPIWPRFGVAAKRVLVRARKESRAPMTLTPGLTAHPPEGEGYTAEARRILLDGAAFQF